MGRGKGGKDWNAGKWRRPSRQEDGEGSRSPLDPAGWLREGESSCPAPAEDPPMPRWRRNLQDDCSVSNPQEPGSASNADGLGHAPGNTSSGPNRGMASRRAGAAFLEPEDDSGTRAWLNTGLGTSVSSSSRGVDMGPDSFGKSAPNSGAAGTVGSHRNSNEYSGGCCSNDGKGARDGDFSRGGACDQFGNQGRESGVGDARSAACGNSAGCHGFGAHGTCGGGVGPNGPCGGCCGPGCFGGCGNCGGSCGCGGCVGPCCGAPMGGFCGHLGPGGCNSCSPGNNSGGCAAFNNCGCGACGCFGACMGNGFPQNCGGCCDANGPGGKGFGGPVPAGVGCAGCHGAFGSCMEGKGACCGGFCGDGKGGCGNCFVDGKGGCGCCFGDGGKGGCKGKFNKGASGDCSEMEGCGGFPGKGGCEGGPTHGKGACDAFNRKGGCGSGCMDFPGSCQGCYGKGQCAFDGGKGGCQAGYGDGKGACGSGCMFEKGGCGGGCQAGCAKGKGACGSGCMCEKGGCGGGWQGGNVIGKGACGSGCMCEQGGCGGGFIPGMEAYGNFGVGGLEGSWQPIQGIPGAVCFMPPGASTGPAPSMPGPCFAEYAPQQGPQFCDPSSSPFAPTAGKSNGKSGFAGKASDWLGKPSENAWRPREKGGGKAGKNQNRDKQSPHGVSALQSMKTGFNSLMAGLTSKLRNAKRRLRHVDPQADILPATAPQSSSNREEMRASWVIHLPEDNPLDRSGSGPEVDEAQRLERLQRMLKEIDVQLEGKVPNGCVMSVNINGRSSTMTPSLQCKRGALSHIASRQEHRFAVAGNDSEKEAPPLRSHASVSSEDVCHPGAPVAFAPSVCLETMTVLGKTEQVLQQPEIDVVEVMDSAAVLRMSKLTGERFELTVYASGDNETLGAAATLVQRGPVRVGESTHRIGPLECSQVYVAWVKVFSASGKAKESKQKGFKTLEAREKTIWDEKDCVILGVDANATAKEIVKAWRLKSLQFHPDKAMEEEKDEAEEMMKRLNLAKTNMLKTAVKADDSMLPSDSSMDLAHNDPDASSFFGGGGADAGPDDDSEDPENSGSDEDENAESQASANEAKRNSRTDPNAVNEAWTHYREAAWRAEAEDGRLHCSLKVEADQPPELKIVERGLNELSVEASFLPLGCSLEVLRCTTLANDDTWVVCFGPVLATSQTMVFDLSDLEENTAYRFRLRVQIEVDPLRLSFAQFAETTHLLSGETCEPEQPDHQEQEDSKPRRRGNTSGAAAQATKLDPVSEGEEEVGSEDPEVDDEGEEA